MDYFKRRCLASILFRSLYQLISKYATDIQHSINLKSYKYGIEEGMLQDTQITPLDCASINII